MPEYKIPALAIRTSERLMIRVEGVESVTWVVRLNIDNAYATGRITQEMIDDTDVDVLQLFLDGLRRQIAELEKRPSPIHP
jgi:hypothetical protein